MNGSYDTTKWLNTCRDDSPNSEGCNLEISVYYAMELFVSDMYNIIITKKLLQLWDHCLERWKEFSTQT